MKIGIDLDDVLLGYNDALISWHNELYGTSHTKDEIRGLYFDVLPGLLKCDLVEVKKRMFDFSLSEKHFNAQPIHGSVEGIRVLKESGNELFVITSKREELREKMLEWSSKNFPPVFNGFYFTNAFQGGKGEKRLKSEVCLELEIRLFIDDDLNNAKDIASVGIPVFLFDQLWNQEEIVSPLITRVYSWQEIVERI